MLAYVFWHRPADPGASGYEEKLRTFLASVGVPATSLRVSHPWWDGWEDWYLVEDWTALGALERGAISGPRQAPHDAVAAASGPGAGAVYGLVRGAPALPSDPAAMHWSDEPVDGALVLWRRRLVLGPAPQYCAVG